MYLLRKCHRRNEVNVGNSPPPQKKNYTNGSIFSIVLIFLASHEPPSPTPDAFTRQASKNLIQNISYRRTDRGHQCCAGEKPNHVRIKKTNTPVIFSAPSL